jgi:DNA-binding NtrC family response regulator
VNFRTPADLVGAQIQPMWNEDPGLAGMQIVQGNHDLEQPGCALVLALLVYRFVDQPGMIALVVDPESVAAGGMAEAIVRCGLQPVVTTSGSEALQRFHSTLPALILLDVDTTDVPGRQLLRHFRSHASHVPIVALVGEVDVPTAVEVVRAGASEVVGKESSIESFRLTLQKVLPEALAARRREAPDRDRAVFFQRYEGLFRRSESMRSVETLVMKVAASDSPVLVEGEAGTGKELVARAIHYLSGRSGKPWQRVSCASLPGDLLEADIFGQDAQATSRRPGKLELADGGTLLLDEIDRLPVMLQARIAHVMRDGQFFRPGGHELVGVDVRMLATTTRDLETLAANVFREDLQRLIGAVTVAVPPLRERREEIRGLVDHFRNRFAAELNRPDRSPSADMLQHLVDYDWPGNLRELENVIKRWVVLGDDANVAGELTARTRARREPPKDTLAPGLGLREIGRRAARAAEQAALRAALERVGGNRAAVCRLLKISYKTLQQKLSAQGPLA